MPTYQSKNTGGTPTTRAGELLTAAFAHADDDADKAASNASTSSRGSLRATLHEAHALITGTEPYLEQNTSDLNVPSAHPVARDQVHAAWNDLLEVTQRTDWVALKDEGKTRFELGAGMCSGPYEAVVLQNLALLQRTRSVLEIGTITGTATLAFALLPSVEKVVALDIEPYLAELVTPYWQRAGVARKIDFKIAPALESLADLSKHQHAPFDLVFIDADKPSHKAYVQAVLDGGLLSENGVILAVSPPSLARREVFPSSLDGCFCRTTQCTRFVILRADRSANLWRENAISWNLFRCRASRGLLQAHMNSRQRLVQRSPKMISPRGTGPTTEASPKPRRASPSKSSARVFRL